MWKVPTRWREVFHAQQCQEIFLSAVFLLLTTLFFALLGILRQGVLGFPIGIYGMIAVVMMVVMYVVQTDAILGFSNQESNQGIQISAPQNSQKELMTDGGQPKDSNAIGILLEAGVSSRRLDNEISLNDGFKSTWIDIISTIEGTDKAQTILQELLDIEADRTTFKDHGTTFELRIDGLYYGNWESEIAFRVDMAAAYLFDEKYDRWNELSLCEQGEILKVLRQLLETCPDCENSLTIAERKKDSPRDPLRAMEMACDHCEVQLYASPHSPGSISE